MKNMVRTQGQAGFSLLGVLIAVMIIGIIAAMAVPRLQYAITTANTSRIKADLSTLDSAIGVYEAENGKEPPAGSITILSEYVKNVESLNPPKGKYWDKNGIAQNIPATTYTISTDSKSKETEAVCGTLSISSLGSKSDSVKSDT